MSVGQLYLRFIFDLPGSIEEKIELYTALYRICSELFDDGEHMTSYAQGQIEFSSTSFLSVTFSDCVIIVDDAKLIVPRT